MRELPAPVVEAIKAMSHQQVIAFLRSEPGSWEGVAHAWGFHPKPRGWANALLRAIQNRCDEIERAAEAMAKGWA